MIVDHPLEDDDVKFYEEADEVYAPGRGPRANRFVGGERTRIRGECGSIEFSRNYDMAVADMVNRPRLAVDPSCSRRRRVGQFPPASDCVRLS